MNQSSPVPLGQSEIAAKICGITMEQTRSIHDEFVRMLGSYNHKAFQSRGRRRRRLCNLDFLLQEKDGLDPVTGLFKTLHLLECDRQTVKRRLKTVPDKAMRISQLVLIALHFQKRRGKTHADLVSYVETVQAELQHFLSKYKIPEPKMSATL